MRAHRLLSSILAVLLLTAGTAAAQTGRVGGTLKDEAGQPIKAGTVTAEFLDANIASVTATTDDKGRFSMVGLRFGEWSFRAQAPGYMGQSTNMNVRTIGVNSPMAFTLTKTFVPPSAIGGLSPKDLQSALAAADDLYGSQRWDDAVAAYRAILAQTPALSAINLQIAAAYRNKKDYDGAIAAYRDLLKMDPSSERAMAGIAMTDVEKGDLAAAEQALQPATQNPTAGRDVWFALGEVRMARAQTADAAAAYQKAVQADPSWGKPSLALGRLAAMRGDQAAARKYLQTVIEADPTSPEAAQATTMLQQIN